MKRILFIKTGALGDVAMTTPAIRRIREAFPLAHVAYLVGRQSHEVLLNNPNLDELIIFEDKVFTERRYYAFIRLLRSLRKRHFDVVIAFHANRLVHLISRLIGAGSRLGFTYGERGRFLTHKLEVSGREDWNPCRLNLELLTALGVDITSAGGMELYLSQQEKEYAGTFSMDAVRGRKPVIGLFPGGGKNLVTDFTNKRWSIRNFNELTGLFIRHYPGCCIILFGSADEKPLSEAAEEGPETIDLIGRTTVRETVALMSRLDLVVTNDSSPMHFATALGIPTVSLFGPTSAQKYAQQGETHKCISGTAACSPCEDRRGRQAADCSNNLCMGTIRPEAVFELSRTLLERS